jgi:hypothetical protein
MTEMLSEDNDAIKAVSCPTGNPNRLTSPRESVDSPTVERSLRVDLVSSGRVIPVAVGIAS